MDNPVILQLYKLLLKNIQFKNTLVFLNIYIYIYINYTLLRLEVLYLQLLYFFFSLSSLTRNA